MSNLPTLYRNVIASLPSELAVRAFLWAADQPNADRHRYAAEKFAREVDAASRSAQALLKMSPHQLSDSKLADLHKFFLIRHANWRYGGNRKPNYT